MTDLLAIIRPFTSFLASGRTQKQHGRAIQLPCGKAALAGRAEYHARGRVFARLLPQAPMAARERAREFGGSQSQ